MRSADRNRVTLIVGVVTALPGVVSLARALPARLQGRTIWDDHALVALAWLCAAVGAACLARVLMAVVAPERLLPRWLAVAILLLLAVAAAGVWLLYAMAASFGP